MENSTILVVDGDPKNLQILKESLESSGFEVITANKGQDAWSVIQSRRPDIIISEVDIPDMDGFQFLEKLQKDPIGATIPLVFLTNRRNVENRIKSLRSGVKDYMIKPLHVKEVIARIKMILRRLERVEYEEVASNRKVIGRLEERSVEELIESYGTERKTGVLTLYDKDNRSGEIYFRDGAVVNAILGNFKAEKAIYQMLPWKEGHFVMTFKEINIEDEISVSNLGLLLQGFKRMQEREKLIKQLPSLDSVLVKTNIFQQIMNKRTVTTNANKFISLFDGKRTISDIIADSNYDDLKTLERITKLYQQGFVRPLGSSARVPHLDEELPESRPASASKYEPSAKETHKEENNSVYETAEEKLPAREEDLRLKVESKFPVEEELQEENSQVPLQTKEEAYPQKPVTLSESEKSADSSCTNGKTKYDDIQRPDSTPNNFASIYDELFNKQNTKTGHLVVICSNHQYRRKLMSALTNGQFVDKTIDPSTSQSIELGKIETPKQHSLEILGISSEAKFLQMLDQLANTLIGYIILIWGESSSNLGYMGYLINSLKVKFKVPHVIAVYDTAQKKSVPLAVIRYGLKLDESEQLVDFNISEVESIKHLLRQLIPPIYSQKSMSDKNNLIKFE